MYHSKQCSFEKIVRRLNNTAMFAQKNALTQFMQCSNNMEFYNNTFKYGLMYILTIIDTGLINESLFIQGKCVMKD